MSMKYWKLGLLALIGLTLNSCSLEHFKENIYNWLAGKEYSWLPKSEQEKIKKDAQAMQSPDKFTANVDLSQIKKPIRDCLNGAADMAHIPRIVIYAIGMNETMFRPHIVCCNPGHPKTCECGGYNDSIDCGIIQANTKYTICPYAKIMVSGKGGKYQPFFQVFKQFGLQDLGGNCSHLSQQQMWDYCNMLRTHSNPEKICLGAYMGALELRKCYDKMSRWKHPVEAPQLQQYGISPLWAGVAACYNGLSPCNRDLGCYTKRFITHVGEIAEKKVKIVERIFGF